MGSRSGVQWEQFFLRFYGVEYCRHLKKDLEKLKDELYDGSDQRFVCDWINPTVELLQRLQTMGFPVRTQNYVVVHLYNPVDSMSAGEMHFQVGRKKPGTLTMKFTMLSGNGIYIIQPKTLSSKDERLLSHDPLGFLGHVQIEMKSLALDAASLLKTAVLMTDSCKLERENIVSLFAIANKEARLGSHSTSSSLFVNEHLSNGSLPRTLVTNINAPEHIVRAGGGGLNIPPNVPVNVCFKNYVQYGGREPPELVSARIGGFMQPGVEVNSIQHNSIYPGMCPVSMMSRLSTFRSEPEEDDETAVAASKETKNSSSCQQAAKEFHSGEACATNNHKAHAGAISGLDHAVPSAKPSADSGVVSNGTHADQPSDRGKTSPMMFSAVPPFQNAHLQRSVSASTTNSVSSNESVDQIYHDASSSSRKTSRTAITNDYVGSNSSTMSYFSCPETGSQQAYPVYIAQLEFERRASFSAEQGRHQVDGTPPRTWSVSEYIGEDTNALPNPAGPGWMGSRLEVPHASDGGFSVRTGSFQDGIAVTTPRTDIVNEYAGASESPVKLRQNGSPGSSRTDIVNEYAGENSNVNAPEVRKAGHQHNQSPFRDVDGVPTQRLVTQSVHPPIDRQWQDFGRPPLPNGVFHQTDRTSPLQNIVRLPQGASRLPPDPNSNSSMPFQAAITDTLNGTPYWMYLETVPANQTREMESFPEESHHSSIYDSWASHGDSVSSVLLPAPVEEINRALQQFQFRAGNT